MFAKKEIIDILKDNSQNRELFAHADMVRKENVGDAIHLRGLIEFSNICRCSCKYCGLQMENKKLERYRLSPDNIISCAKDAVDAGYKTIVLQSGEDIFYSKNVMCKIISEIKSMDIALTLSIGERSLEDYKEFRDFGADRYLLRIETTDANLYKKMHPNMDFKNRLKCLYNIKNLGYETGCGSLIGLPGQSIESIANDILFFKELDADMIGIGPFIVHPDTPLKDAENGNFTLALKAMAITRIMLKNINIPATTAMETLNPNGRIIALQSGANVIMPNVTTLECRKKYEIYPGKITPDKDIQKHRNCLEEKLKSIGRTISKEHGFRRQ